MNEHDEFEDAPFEAYRAECARIAANRVARLPQGLSGVYRRRTLREWLRDLR